MSPERFKELWPNASQDTIRNNQHLFNERPEQKPKSGNDVRAAGGADPVLCEKSSPELESTCRNKLSPTVREAAGNPGRYLIRYEIRRNRLIRDSENVCTKAFTDCIAVSGLIYQDCFSALKVQFRQIQVPKEEEGTMIEIFPPGMWPADVVDTGVNGWHG